MQYFYSRLVEERKKLKFTQDEMAKELDISKRAYCNYEAGVSAPSVLQMGTLALLGFDVYYITTGERLPAVNYQADRLNSSYVAKQELLSEREYALLDNYRAADDDGKRAVEAASAALAKSKVKKA